MQDLVGSLNEIKVICSSYLPDNTIIVNEKTWECIKNTFPDKTKCEHFYNTVDTNIKPWICIKCGFVLN